MFYLFIIIFEMVTYSPVQMNSNWRELLHHLQQPLFLPLHGFVFSPSRKILPIGSLSTACAQQVLFVFNLLLTITCLESAANYTQVFCVDIAITREKKLLFYLSLKMICCNSSMLLFYFVLHPHDCVCTWFQIKPVQCGTHLWFHLNLSYPSIHPFLCHSVACPSNSWAKVNHGQVTSLS